MVTPDSATTCGNYYRPAYCDSATTTGWVTTTGAETSSFRNEASTITLSLVPRTGHNESDDLEIIKARIENAYNSRWIQREGKRLNVKAPIYPFIAKQFIRKMMPCNRKGMGLRIRRREQN